jgi:hypothetical protein
MAGKAGAAGAGGAQTLGQMLRELQRRSMFVPVLVLLAVFSLAAGVALAAGLHTAPERALPTDAAVLHHLKIARRDKAQAALSSPTGPIIGTNDAAGWGAGAAERILHGDITWDRVALGGPYDTLAISLHDGFKVLAIVGNVEVPLSQVNASQWGAEVVTQLKANPGISIAEAGNESYLKGGVANPVQYGHMYLDAVEDMKAAHIRTPLLFNMTGDIPLGTWAAPGSWSEDAKGGGWLREAVAGVPGLAAAILANGVSIHPYGAVGENTHDDWGTAAAAADEAVAGAVLGSIPPFYVTEIGYSLHRCGATAGACSKREQARKMQSAYEVLLADSHIAGIWWYQSHDDSTGAFGFMNDNNQIRPSFRILSAFGAAVGQ